MNIGIFALWACIGGRGGDLPTTTVTRGPFEIVLAIPGELQAVRSVTLSAPDMGGQAKVTWLVDAGTRVAEGDVLVKFDDTDMKEHIEQAKTELEVALTKIEQRKAQLAVHLGDVENEVTSSTLSRERASMRITDSETVPRVERESARIDVEEATIAVARAQAGLESARLEGEAELELLRLEAEKAQREVTQSERILSEAALVAPSPGIVILPSVWKGGSRGPVTVGDSLWGGQTIVELPDLTEMEVQAWVHEVDAARVAVDQAVTVVIDAHPDTKHPGHVAKVADLAVQRKPDATVKHLEVTVALDTTSPLMKPGMTVRAEVLVAKHDAVLAVPQEAVFHDGTETYVLRSGLSGFSRTKVTLGATNDTHVIVTEGLDDGDVIALADPDHADSPPSAGAPSAAPEPPSEPAE